MSKWRVNFHPEESCRELIDRKSENGRDLLPMLSITIVFMYYSQSSIG